MSVTTSRTYITALVAANDRLLRSRPSELMEIREPLRDLANWLYWALSVDEQLWEDSGYEVRRDTDEWGRVIPGLRHAWNLMRHHGHRMDEFVVVRPKNGMSFPLTFPLAFRDTEWRPFDELPVISSRKQNKRLAAQEQAYQDHLAGWGVRLIALHVTAFLIREAGRS